MDYGTRTSGHGLRATGDFSVLDLRDKRFANLSLVSYVPQPGTGTPERRERLVAAWKASHRGGGRG